MKGNRKSLVLPHQSCYPPLVVVLPALIEELQVLEVEVAFSVRLFNWQNLEEKQTHGLKTRCQGVVSKRTEDKKESNKKRLLPSFIFFFTKTPPFGKLQSWECMSTELKAISVVLFPHLIINL